MKRWPIFLFLLFLTFEVVAQRGDVVLCEGFFSPWLEEGWDVKGDDWAVWYISNSAFAGCKSRELQMVPDINFSGTTRLVSPVVELHKYDYIYFQFNHFFDACHGNINAIIGVATAQGEDDWTTIWNDTLTGRIDQSRYLLTFDMQEWSSKDVRFCLFYSGEGAYVNSWYIDNVIIFGAKKNKYGKMDESDDDGGFIASLSKIFTLRGPDAGRTTSFSSFRRSKNKFARIVEGRKGRK